MNYNKTNTLVLSIQVKKQNFAVTPEGLLFVLPHRPPPRKVATLFTFIVITSLHVFIVLSPKYSGD